MANVLEGFLISGMALFCVASIRGRYREQWFDWFTLSLLAVIPFYALRFAIDPAWWGRFHPFGSLGHDLPLVLVAASLIASQRNGRSLTRSEVAAVAGVTLGYALLLSALPRPSMYITAPAASFTITVVTLWAVFPKMIWAVGRAGAAVFVFVIVVSAVLQLLPPIAGRAELPDAYRVLAFLGASFKVFQRVAGNGAGVPNAAISRAGS